MSVKKGDLVIKVGVNVLTNKVGPLGDELDKYASAAVRKAAFDVQGHARRFIEQKGAVDTGNLLNSIQVDAAPGRLDATVYTVVHYAPYVEYGTVNMAARSFMEPAAMYVREGLVKALKNIVALKAAS